MVFAAVVALLALGIAGWSAWDARTASVLIQRIDDTPTSPIGELRNGPGEVTGRVSDRSTVIETPLTREPCVWWRVTVDEYSGGEHPGWATVFDKEGSGRCVLEDDSGACVLDLEGAVMQLDPDAHTSASPHDPADPELRAALLGLGFDPSGFVAEKRIRVVQHVLRVGDRIYALGHATSADDGLAQLKAGTEPLFVTDRDEQTTRAQAVQDRRQAVIWTVVALLVAAVGGITAVLIARAG